MDELREAGLTQADADSELAADVRTLARGDKPEVPMMYSKTSAAIAEVTRAEVDRADAPAANDAQHEDRVNALDQRLWQTMLAPDTTISVRKRLKAFEALAKADAFRPCTCGGPEPALQLREQKFDAALAYIVRLLGSRHYRAAAAAVEFPETYLAVRDAIDAAVRARRTSRE